MLTLAILSLAAASANPAPPSADDAAMTADTVRYPGDVIPDPELADMRGGFRLPSGIDVNIAVQSQTSVDGQLLLRSIYRLDTGAPTLALYAPKVGESVSTAPVHTGGSGNNGLAVMFDRSTGVVIVPGGAGAQPTVSVGSGANRQMDVSGDALAPLDLAPGSATAVAGGTLRLDDISGSLQAQLEGADIDVRHFFGQGYGTFIANSANDRTIDTVTTISLDLGNTSPETLGSSLLRVDAMALDAVRGMIR